jgi:hypothetical protein
MRSCAPHAHRAHGLFQRGTNVYRGGILLFAFFSWITFILVDFFEMNIQLEEDIYQMLQNQI